MPRACAPDYEDDCEIPDVREAGDWAAEVKLDDQLVWTDSVRMQCAKRHFETLDGVCEDCGTGIACSKAGVTTSTMTIEAGYWRSGQTSVDVRECYLGVAACRGSVNGSVQCHQGYEGPLCNTCSRTYFMNWATRTCESCAVSSASMIGHICDTRDTKMV